MSSNSDESSIGSFGSARRRQTSRENEIDDYDEETTILLLRPPEPLCDESSVHKIRTKSNQVSMPTFSISSYSIFILFTVFTRSLLELRHLNYPKSSAMTALPTSSLTATIISAPMMPTEKSNLDLLDVDQIPEASSEITPDHINLNQNATSERIPQTDPMSLNFSQSFANKLNDERLGQTTAEIEHLKIQEEAHSLIFTPSFFIGPIMLTLDFSVEARKSENFNFKSPFSQETEFIPDFGGLNMTSFTLSASEIKRFERSIRYKDDYWYHKERKHFISRMDHEEHISEDLFGYDDFNHLNRTCSRPKWSFDRNPSCNNFHESFVYNRPFENSMEYLHKGNYRNAFLFNFTMYDDDGKTSSHELPILKSLRSIHEVNEYQMMKVALEANVMDRLTFAPSIINIHGYCGTSVVVEKGSELSERVITKDIFPHGYIAQKELDKLQVDDVHPFINYTNEEKLDLALQMAQGLAELHGHAAGVLVMDDVKIHQFLISDTDGRILLNDFGNTVALSFDQAKGEYCDFEMSYSGGTYHAPEEVFGGGFVNESVDTWSFGHILFSLLTGLYPYYQIADEGPEIFTALDDRGRHIWDRMVQNMTLVGGPYIDPRYSTRSCIENHLVDIMDRCFQVNREKRATIFEIVQNLEEIRKICNEAQSNESKIIMDN